MRERRRPLRRGACAGVVVGAIAALLCAVLQTGWLVVTGCGTLGDRALALPHGLAFAGLAVCFGAVVGGVQGLAYVGFGRWGEALAAGRATVSRWRAGLYTAALTPLVAVLVASALGERLSSAALRLAVAVGMGAGLLGLTFLGFCVILRVPARPLVAAALLVVAAAGLVVLDARLFVRRYPELHVGLELAGFAALELAVLAAARGLHARRRWAAIAAPHWALLILAASVGAATFSLSVWRSPAAARLRAVAAEDGGAAGGLLDLARLLGVAMEEAAAPPVDLPAPPAAAPSSAHHGADVILITVDAMRADHLGAWGYPRPTSPRLDALAGESVVFERAYAAAPHTSYSVTSLLSGAPTHALGRVRRLDSLPLLVDSFAAAGYHTAGFFPPAIFYIDRERFAALEASWMGFQTQKVHFFTEHNDAPGRTDEIIELFEKKRPARVFVWAHYLGPHEPYSSHPEVMEFGERAIDRYDSEIRWVDGEIGRLLDYLRANRPGAIVVVTADHGEEFGEHGGAYHGSSLFEEQVHVPLIIHVPGGPARRIAAPVGAVAIAPTLAALTGVARPGEATGVDLSPWLGEAPPPESALPPVFAELDTQKLVAFGNDRLICDVARGFCRLFTLGDDPGQRRDASARFPARAAELRAFLDGWLASIGDAGGDRERILARGELGDRRAVPALARIVADGHADPMQRLAAARSLTRLIQTNGTEDIDAATRGELRAATGSSVDRAVRAWASVAAYHLGESDELPGGESDELRARVALAAARRRHPDAVSLLVAAMPGADVGLRITMIDALGATADQAATPALLAAYEDVLTRQYAARALGRVRDPSVIPFLRARMLDDPYVGVRAAAVRALGEIGDGSALTAVRARFHEDPETPVVAAAAWALARLGEGVAVEDGVARLPGGARELWLIPGEPPAGMVVKLSVDGAEIPIDTSVVRDAYPLAVPEAPGKALEIRVVSGNVTHVLARQ